mgnify:CR=1 FL=1
MFQAVLLGVCGFLVMTMSVFYGVTRMPVHRSAVILLFELVAGALSVGIGFGLQNIVNNFVSGMILLIERPIKVGDLIEVGGTFGQVESIGARSTAIRSFDNFHIIVPNSAFLESNVVNWTHTDDLVRVRLRVGVAYGSPTRRVEELILQAVRELEEAVIPPEPMVIFEDFGDNALIFDLYFWVLATARTLSAFF